MTHLKIPVGNFPSFEADYVRLFPRLRARGTPPGAFPRLVLKPAQGKKIYLNYGLGDRSSILVTRNILSSSCYLEVPLIHSGYYPVTARDMFRGV